MELSTRENYLVQIMNKGFARAATAFSQMTRKPVSIINSQSVLVRHDNEFGYYAEEHGPLHVLVTQIIGEIGGRSYLIFNQDECEEILQVIKGKSFNAALHDAFLCEIDNVISASVISEISNALKLEIYGDVPQLIKLDSGELQHYMDMDSRSTDPSSLILCNTTFRFDNETVHPQFIWKLNSRIFEIIPLEKPSPLPL